MSILVDCSTVQPAGIAPVQNRTPMDGDRAGGSAVDRRGDRTLLARKSQEYSAPCTDRPDRSPWAHVANLPTYADFQCHSSVGVVLLNNRKIRTILVDQL